MKIVLFGLNGRGGMLHYTSQFANALSKRADVYVVLPSYSETKHFDKSVKLIRIDAPPEIVGTFFQTWQFWKHFGCIKNIIQLKPDIIHIMDSHPWYIAYVYWLSGVNMVATQHDPTQHSGEKTSLLGILTKFTNNFIRKKVKKIIVHGEAMKNDLVSKGVPESKLIVVPHGDYSFFTKYGRDVKTERYTILFFGRIVKYKGVDTLLKAVPLIMRDIPEIKVIIAGEGDFSPYQGLLTDSIKDNVELHNGYIPDEKVAELFRRCSAVVLPYDDATQSGIIPIAYAFRKAVIASAVGSIPEAVEDGVTGYLVRPKDPEGLAKKVVLLLNDEKDLKDFGNNGYMKMKQMMDWDRIVERVYDEI